MTINTIENCKVVLTEHDEAKLGGELAKLNIEYGKKDEERKEAAKAAADELKGLDEHIMRISRTLRDGYEFRGVPCVVELNKPKAGWATVTRTDNGQSHEREMTAGERQPALFPGENEAGGEPVTKIDGAAAYHCSRCQRAYNPDSPAANPKKALCGRCNEPEAISAEDAAAALASKAQSALDLLRAGGHEPRTDGTHIRLPKGKKWSCGTKIAEGAEIKSATPEPGDACPGCVTAVVTFLADIERAKDRDQGSNEAGVSPFVDHCNEP